MYISSRFTDYLIGHQADAKLRNRSTGLAAIVLTPMLFLLTTAAQNANANPSASPAIRAKASSVSIGIKLGGQTGMRRYRPGYYGSHYPRYYGSGFYNRAYFSGPALGLYVPLLPWGYTTLWIGAEPYYRSNNVYYVADVDGGYRVVSPPRSAPVTVEVSPSTNDAPNGELAMLFPRNGQTETQATFDRIECERAANQTTGFNPSQSPADAVRHASYRLALKTCLDGRGYTLK